MGGLSRKYCGRPLGVFVCITDILALKNLLLKVLASYSLVLLLSTPLLRTFLFPPSAPSLPLSLSPSFHLPFLLLLLFFHLLTPFLVLLSSKHLHYTDMNALYNEGMAMSKLPKYTTAILYNSIGPLQRIG